MKAGSLRFLATYQTPVRSNDPIYNDSIVSYRDVQDFRISIEPLKANEILKYKAVQMDVTHRIGARWTPVIKQDGRFVYDDKIFDIFSIFDVDLLNLELMILANQVDKPKVGN